MAGVICRASQDLCCRGLGVQGSRDHSGSSRPRAGVQPGHPQVLLKLRCREEGTWPEKIRPGRRPQSVATQDRAGLGERGLKPCRTAGSAGTSHTPCKWFSLLKREEKKSFKRTNPSKGKMYCLTPRQILQERGGGVGGRQALFLGPRAAPASEGAGAPWPRAPWPGAHLPTAALKNNFLSINANKSLDPSSK